MKDQEKIEQDCAEVRHATENRSKDPQAWEALIGKGIEILDGYIKALTKREREQGVFRPSDQYVELSAIALADLERMLSQYGCRSQLTTYLKASMYGMVRKLNKKEESLRVVRTARQHADCADSLDIDAVAVGVAIDAESVRLRGELQRARRQYRLGIYRQYADRLGELSEANRLAFRAYYGGCLSLKDTADVLDITEDAAEQRLRRARKRLEQPPSLWNKIKDVFSGDEE